MLKALREQNGKYLGNRPMKISKSTWKERDAKEVSKLIIVTKIDDSLKWGETVVVPLCCIHSGVFGGGVVGGCYQIGYFSRAVGSVHFGSLPNGQDSSNGLTRPR